MAFFYWHFYTTNPSFYMMKKHIAFLHLAIILVAAGCGASKKNSMNAKPAFAPNPVVAHRGAWKKNNYPQNSIASLKEAIRLGCTGSEFDVRMTADDSLVINHDAEYNKLHIDENTYSKLAQTPLPNGEKLPTLREYLIAGLENNKHTRLVVEIKPTSGGARTEKLAVKAVALIHELNAQNMVAYISFDSAMCRHIMLADPNASVQYLNGDKDPEAIEAAGFAGADYHYEVFKKHPGWIADLKNRNLIVNAWTVNDEPTMDWLLQNKADFITTNEPELLLQKLAIK